MTGSTSFAPRLEDVARLPGVPDLLVPERLSALVGRPVRPVRMRLKPGTSLVVAWEAADQEAEQTPAIADVGWAAVLVSEDKRAAAVRRARRRSACLDVRALDAGGDAGPGEALIGSMLADPSLGARLDSAARRRDLAGASVLAYNPRRRAVLATADGGSVVRVDSRSLLRILRAEEILGAVGAPVLTSRQVGRGAHVLAAPRWGIGTLEDLRSADAAQRAGTAVGALHRRLAPDARVRNAGAAQARRDGRIAAARTGPLVPEHDPLLRALLPELADRVESVRTLLAERLGADPGADTVIHGDLSPDQILIGPGDEPDGRDPGLRLIDLDRTGIGPAGLDVGAFRAACEQIGAPDLAAAMRAGWEGAAGDAAERLLGDLGAWTARAHLASIMDPLRRCAPDWADRVASRLALAEAALAETAPAEPERGPQTAADPRLPGLAHALARPGAELIAHRPGRRAVVRTSEDTYLKVTRPGRTRRLRAAIERAAPFDGPFRMPAVLDCDDQILTLSAVPGTPLHEAGAFTGAAWEQAWRDALDAWGRAISSSAQPRGTSEPWPEGAHGPEAERSVLAAWRDRARETAGVRESARRERAVADALALLAELAPPSRLATIHRDLHDKQILWDPERGAGLIDVDTACRGDAAVDLGNLRAHVRWREIQEVWPAARGAAARRLIDETVAELGLDPDRVRVYEAATAARLACVYAVRDSGGTDDLRALDLAEELVPSAIAHRHVPDDGPPEPAHRPCPTSTGRTASTHRTSPAPRRPQSTKEET